MPNNKIGIKQRIKAILTSKKNAFKNLSKNLTNKIEDTDFPLTTASFFKFEYFLLKKLKSTFIYLNKISISLDNKLQATTQFFWFIIQTHILN